MSWKQYDEEYEKDKQHYRQADDAWLKSKIENEKDSIRINQAIIGLSERDILICNEILEERKIQKVK